MSVSGNLTPKMQYCLVMRWSLPEFVLLFYRLGKAYELFLENDGKVTAIHPLGPVSPIGRGWSSG